MCSVNITKCNFSFFFFECNATNIFLSHFLFLPSGTGSFRPIHTRLAPSSRPPLSKASPAASSSATTSQLSSEYYFYSFLTFYCLFFCCINAHVNSKQGKLYVIVRKMFNLNISFISSCHSLFSCHCKKKTNKQNYSKYKEHMGMPLFYLGIPI